MRDDQRPTHEQAGAPLDSDDRQEPFEHPQGEWQDSELDWDEFTSVPEDEIPPPPWLSAEDSGEQERRQPPRAATYVAFGVVVMALLGVLMTITSVQLYLDRARAADALRLCVDRLALAYAGPGSGDEPRKRIAWLRRTIDEGDYTAAQQALAAFASPAPTDPGAGGPQVGQTPGAGGQQPSGQGGAPDPRQARDLPPEAQQYFAQHREQWEGFFGFSRALAQLSRAGAPIEELEDLRGSMVEAARLGRTDRVEQLLQQARQKMQLGLGQNLPDSLKGKLEAFGRAFQRAQSQRRDVREAARLAQQAEQAARRGNFERAEKLLDRATQALRAAPHPRAQRPPVLPRGMPSLGPEVGFFRFAADLFAGVMQAEEPDLTRVWESIQIATDAIREHNAEQIREILGRAVAALRTVGERRREMGRRLEAAQQRARGAASEGQRQAQQARRERAEEIMLERITALLGRVRAMPEEQFTANRQALARELLAALTTPIEGPVPEREANPEERVRAKMRVAGQMLAQVRERTQTDTGELEARFEEVRRLIATHEYARAEELVDEGVGAMRDLLSQAGPGEAADALGTQGTALPGQDEGAQIDLRAIGRNEPIRRPPPPVGADDTGP
ncbi:MAG: hypothetical protein AB7Y46_05300 [Armatimonadota bacterium]